jgi:hypothetical protein
MKLNYINLFRIAMENNPGRSKKELCEIVKISPDRLRRYMKDTNTPSFYRHTTSVKKYKKSNHEKSIDLENSVLVTPVTSQIRKEKKVNKFQQSQRIFVKSKQCNSFVKKKYKITMNTKKYFCFLANRLLV